MFSPHQRVPYIFQMTFRGLRTAGHGIKNRSARLKLQYFHTYNLKLNSCTRCRLYRSTPAFFNFILILSLVCGDIPGLSCQDFSIGDRLQQQGRYESGVACIRSQCPTVRTQTEHVVDNSVSYNYCLSDSRFSVR